MINSFDLQETINGKDSIWGLLNWIESDGVNGKEYDDSGYGERPEWEDERCVPLCSLITNPISTYYIAPGNFLLVVIIQMQLRLLTRGGHSRSTQIRLYLQSLNLPVVTSRNRVMLTKDRTTFPIMRTTLVHRLQAALETPFWTTFIHHPPLKRLSTTDTRNWILYCIVEQRRMQVLSVSHQKHSLREK